MSIIDRNREQDCKKCFWWYEIGCVKRENCYGWETKEEAYEK